MTKEEAREAIKDAFFENPEYANELIETLEQTMSDDPIKDDLSDTDLLSEKEFEDIFKDLQCATNCESCPLIKRCEDKKKRGIMTTAEIAKLFAKD